MAEVTLDPGSWLNLTNLFEFNGILFWDQTDYPDIAFDDGDTYLQLTDSQAKRIDLVAFDAYGNSTLFWVLMLANDVLIPNQFVEGQTIRIPAISTVNTLLTNPQQQS